MNLTRRLLYRLLSKSFYFKTVSRKISGFKKLIEKFSPAIQIETEKTNFDSINYLLT